MEGERKFETDMGGKLSDVFQESR